MTNEELIKQSFTQDQRNWLAKNGEPVTGTQTEKISALARQLHDAKIYADKDQRVKLVKLINRKGKVYDIQSFATAAGFTDQKIGNKTLTAADQFYSAYNDPKTPDNLKKEWNVAINDVYGPGGTEFLRRRLEVEKRNREYDAQRKFDDRSTAGKILDAVFSPRETEARLEGRAPSDKDKWLDRTENVLMALPFGAGTRLAVSAFRAPKMASRILRGVAAGSSIAGVPHAMEGLDAAFYSPEENLDRSVYSEGDAIIGTVTNAAAPYIAGRTLKRLGRFTPWGKSGAPGLNEMELAQVDNAIQNGLWKSPSKETLKAVEKFNSEKNKLNQVDELLQFGPEEDPKNMTKLELRRAQAVANMEGPSNPARDYLEAGFIQKKAEEAGVNATQVLGKADNQLNIFGDILNFEDEVLKNADLGDLIRYRVPKLSKAADIAEDAAKNFVTNKYGSKRDADVVLSGVSRMAASIDPKFDASKWLKDIKDKEIDKARTELKKAQASEILKTEKDLDDEDRKWLNELVKNPSMMEGYGEGSSSKFKNWLLVRGQDILRGTELFRPSYEVE